eukprot:CAMPEP_0181510986 /NCGR_PEP_ID=MMETSP1110-20121109/61177_1 /TAXON_ID=174948 /ORGANISM="Symbiodinium sp., Strain CCMP421" /LENGTH=60 /DNA_ID=CAMNT_0023640661 /DNA_START=120 /DNA_END=302 /DNA_ORIENTATION=+
MQHVEHSRDEQNQRLLELTPARLVDLLGGSKVRQGQEQMEAFFHANGGSDFVAKSFIRLL